MSDEYPKISVIVSTYNRPDALRLVLSALAKQDVENFEVVIADDGSSVETRNMVESLKDQLPFDLKYVWQEDVGYRLAMIRNKATAAASGEYMVFLDGDSVPLPSFIKNHQKMAESGYFVVGNRVLLNQDFTSKVLQDQIPIYKWAKLKWLYELFKKNCNRFLAFLLFSNLPNWLRKLRSKKWRGIRGCNLAVWKKDLFAVNGFDESFSGWGYEDSDFVVRLLRLGVLRKDGHFAVPVLHLWHRENSRSNEQENYSRLESIINSDNVRAQSGVEQYLK